MRRLKPATQRQLRHLGVALVYLYGSEATRRATRFSDVDVGVVLRDPRPLKQRDSIVRLRVALSQCLEPILARGPYRELDLVLLQTASPILRFEAINSGIPIFIADPTFKADYEAEVIRDYLDVQPLVEAHYQAALERVA